MADKPVPIFGKPYSTTTALGEPMPVRCGYRKCGILFMTYEPRRKYCCTKHKNSQSALLKREAEALNGPLQAAIAPVTQAQIDFEQRQARASEFAQGLKTIEGAQKNFDLSVQMALEWVLAGQNALGPFTLEHIKDEKIRRAVNNRLAQMNATSDNIVPLIVDEQTALIREAMGLGAPTEHLEAIPEPIDPAIDHKQAPKTEKEKAEEL